KGGLLDSFYLQEIKDDFHAHDFSAQHSFEIFVGGSMSSASLALLRKRLLHLEAEIREHIVLDTKYQTSKLTNVTLYCGYRPLTPPMMKKYLRSANSAV